MISGRQIAAHSPSGPSRRGMAALTRRRTLVLAGFAAASGGVLLNWDWLTAIGAAPILLGFAPCAAMCALGMCMRGGGSSACQSRSPAGVAPQILETRDGNG